MQKYTKPYLSCGFHELAGFLGCVCVFFFGKKRFEFNVLVIIYACRAVSYPHAFSLYRRGGPNEFCLMKPQKQITAAVECL